MEASSYVEKLADAVRMQLPTSFCMQMTIDPVRVQLYFGYCTGRLLHAAGRQVHSGSHLHAQLCAHRLAKT
jgi:hypothetical protein